MLAFIITTMASINNGKGGDTILVSRFYALKNIFEILFLDF